MPFFTTLPFGKSTLEKAFSEAKSQSFVLFFQKRGGAKNPSNYFAILFLKIYFTTFFKGGAKKPQSIFCYTFSKSIYI
jgi:hypothetical protein